MKSSRGISLDGIASRIRRGDLSRRRSASIANEFTEAVGDLYTSSLVALGLILFFITFIVLAIARYMLMRIQRKIG
jgi:ABC-type phosphate transport system permease subunit